MDRYKNRFSFKLYALVIMDNHAHLLIRPGSLHNISCVMQAILLSYSVKYCKKYDYVGHVWQGRFEARLVESEEYLRECVDYIHDNPLKAGMVKASRGYPWSSCRNFSVEDKLVGGLLEIDQYTES